MTEERESKPHGLGAYVAWIAALLPMLYVAAYAALVEPIPLLLESEAQYGSSESVDRIGHLVFAPINSIDRKIRRSTWAPWELDLSRKPGRAP